MTWSWFPFCTNLRNGVGAIQTILIYASTKNSRPKERLSRKRNSFLMNLGIVGRPTRFFYYSWPDIKNVKGGVVDRKLSNDKSFTLTATIPIWIMAPVGNSNVNSARRSTDWLFYRWLPLRSILTSYFHDKGAPFGFEYGFEYGITFHHVWQDWIFRNVFFFFFFPSFLPKPKRRMKNRHFHRPIDFRLVSSWENAMDRVWVPHPSEWIHPWLVNITNSIINNNPTTWISVIPPSPHLLDYDFLFIRLVLL